MSTAVDAPPPTRPRHERWESLAEWPLIATSFVFLAAYSIQVIARPHGVVASIVEVVMWLVWALFGLDYVVTTVLHPRRMRWIVRHPLDLALVLFPALGPLRLLRFVYLVAVLQKRARRLARGSVVAYSVAAATLISWIAAVAVLQAERDSPAASIRTIGDALWWAIATITTVGYGDYTPVTLVGRLIAVGLMLCGIALVGVITASFATWLMEQVGQRSDDPRSASDR